MSVQGRQRPGPARVVPPEADVRPAQTLAEEPDAWDRAGQMLVRLMPDQSHPRLLWLLILASLLVRLLWLARPEGSLIFDEKYYVNAARMIAGVAPQQDIYQDKPLWLDPNSEHPPLAKAIVAGAIRLLGDNPYAWRLPSVFFGTAVILLMYGIARRVGASRTTALLAAALLSLDNLEFVHSRIFTLDIFQMAFMLLGAYLYLSWRPTLSGAGFALAALCKIGGAFGLAAMAAYEGLRLVTSPEPWQQRWRPAARRLAQMAVTFVLVFLPLLGVMDRLWTGYSQPLEHLQHIISYGTLLRREIPSGIESYPWQWLWNERQIPYLQVDQQVKVGEEVREKRPIIQFLGAMNPYVLGLLPLGLAIAAHALRRKQNEGRDLAAFSLAWFAMTYLPFIAASVFGQRISYLFYFLPTLPAITLSGAYFLRETGLPRLVIWGYSAAVLLAFYGYFPFKPVP